MTRFEELALMIKAAQREGDRRVNQALRPLKLTAAQAEVLTVLALTGPVSLSELGKLLVSEGGHPSRLVARLAQRGLVVSTVCKDDARRVEVKLSPRGSKLAEAARSRKDRLIAESGSQLTEANFHVMSSMLLAYLKGSPWEDTVRLRRALALNHKAPGQQGQKA